MAKNVFFKSSGTVTQSFRIGKNGITIYTGTDNPFTTPPIPIDNFNTGDLYIQNDTMYTFIYNGINWVINNFPTLENVQTSNFTALLYKEYPVDTTSGEIIITPPASPNSGDYFVIFDSSYNSENNAIVIDTNLQKLYGSNDNLVINKNGTKVTLEYKNSTIGWIYN